MGLGFLIGFFVGSVFGAITIIVICLAESSKDRKDDE